MGTDEVSVVLEKLSVAHGRCVTVKGSSNQMALPGGLVGRFLDAYTVLPSARTLRRRRYREKRAAGDVS